MLFNWNPVLFDLRAIIFLLAEFCSRFCLFRMLEIAGCGQWNTDLPVIRIHSDRKWPDRVVDGARFGQQQLMFGQQQLMRFNRSSGTLIFVVQ